MLDLAREDAPPKQPVRWRRRSVAMTVWTVLFAAASMTVGVPTDPAFAFVWLWAVVIAWNIDRPWREHLRFGRDWWPAVAVLVVYTVSRGYADRGAPIPHVRELVAADERLWGWATGGVPPSVWLQRALFDPVHIHWWDVAVSFVYFSHFLVVPGIAAILWVRNRARWGHFMRRWITLSIAGLATYFAYPAAPPWLAARYGLPFDVGRISTRGWDAIGLHGAGNAVSMAQLDASNQIAAMPSLHSAFALLAVLFIAPAVRRRWWPLLAAYPLAMTFTLMYGGEHWVIDVLAGWSYVLVTLAAVSGAERWWTRRRLSRELERSLDDIEQRERRSIAVLD